MSTPPVSPVEQPPTRNADRIPAALGLVADAAGVVAFLLAGVKVIALVLGIVAVLLGVYLIVGRWGKPFRFATLGAVVILAIGASIVGGVIGHGLSGATRAHGASGTDTTPGSGNTKSTPDTASPSATGTPTAVTGAPVQSASPSPADSQEVNSPLTPVNLGDPQTSIMTNANGFGKATQVTINAKVFTYGLSGCQIACGTATSDFNLGRSYSTLTARLGVRDSSRTGGSAHIQIVADGNTIESRTVQLGVSYDIHLSVKNVLRLQFVESNDGGVIAAVGDPIVAP
jgi:hypothetical protein